jgi:hypothetical protein
MGRSPLDNQDVRRLHLDCQEEDDGIKTSEGREALRTAGLETGATVLGTQLLWLQSLQIGGLSPIERRVVVENSGTIDQSQDLL